MDALWDAATTGRPYDVLLDGRSRGDGHDHTLARRIRERAELAAARVIVLGAADVEWMRAAGVDGHLRTPVDEDELERAVRRVLGREPTR
jgi:DNA-binding NarL/FixJ family response regulator